MFYEFKLGHNVMEATKNISSAKGKCAVDHNMVARWLKKFCLDCKSLDDQAKIDRLKTMDFEAMFQTIEINPESIRRICHLVNFMTSVKVSGAAEFSDTLPKYWEIFDSP